MTYNKIVSYFGWYLLQQTFCFDPFGAIHNNLGFRSEIARADCRGISQLPSPIILASSGNKPLYGPMFIQIYVTKWHHSATITFASFDTIDYLDMPFQFQGWADIDYRYYCHLDKMSQSKQRNPEKKTVCKNIGMINI